MNMFTIILVITVFLEIVTALSEMDQTKRSIGKRSRDYISDFNNRRTSKSAVCEPTIDKFNQTLVPNVTRPRETLNKCGLDKSPIKVVYEGKARIETYPWIGILYYKNGEKVYSTTVVLVTLQIVVGSALDIDRLPKSDFRSQARVVLGRNCSRPGIKIRDYSYHPDFNKVTYSSVALIQLETNFRSKDFYPVCAPPKLLEKPQFYVLTLSDDCKSSKIKIYKMAYISPDQCKTYYRRTQLDMEKMWPTHTICARALNGKECIWKNGAILLLRQENKWSLIGLGIQGPGCRAPSRFLDYVQHKSWLRSSVAGIGQPTVTRISRNQLVLRRSLSNVQRYGPCDLGEIKEELYTDRTTVHRYPTNKQQRARYNFTIFANLEYSCVVFRVFHYSHPRITRDFPYIRLHRWCMTPGPICSSFQYLQIDFRVTIWFKESVTYHVAAYGQEVKIIDMKKVMVRVNRLKPFVQTTFHHGEYVIW